MKIRSVDTLYCDAGWRPWIFLKVVTDEGIVGFGECTESNGSPRAIGAAIDDLRPLIVGRDPVATEAVFWDLYRATRQSPGGVIQKALGGLENALLDVKAQALGIPVFELLGGPLREKIPLYWSHCGTTRARSWKAVGQEPLTTFDDVAALGKEVVERGFTALKTNIIFPGDPPAVLMQGFRGPHGSLDQNIDVRTLEALEELIGTFRDAVGSEVGICLDLNFNFKTEGNIAVARTLAPFDLMWLEIDSYDERALRKIADASPIPIASGENLFLARQFRPFFEHQSMEIAVIDVLWNGLVQSKKIADAAETYELNVAPHNYYSHLATLISAHFCACVPNVRIMEVDVDDVPWKEDLISTPPDIRNGHLHLTSQPGWGATLNEEVLEAHPWPR